MNISFDLVKAIILQQLKEHHEEARKKLKYAPDAQLELLKKGFQGAQTRIINTESDTELDVLVAMIWRMSLKEFFDSLTPGKLFSDWDDVIEWYKEK